jgi:transcriptional regulator GlxA family with amidase domain
MGGISGSDSRGAAISRLKAFLRRMPYVAGFLDEPYLDEAAESLYADIANEFGAEVMVDDAALGERVQLLVDESRRQASATKAAIDGLYGYVDISLANAETPRIDRRMMPWSRHPGIRKAIAIMMDRYGERLTTDELAGAAGLGKSQFIAAFKSETGLTPHEYLRRIRIDSAMEFLRAGDSVTETCFKVGFSSLSGFEAAFVDLTGMKPRESQKGRQA